jgi:hypothetical protein
MSVSENFSTLRLFIPFALSHRVASCSHSTTNDQFTGSVTTTFHSEEIFRGPRFANRCLFDCLVPRAVLDFASSFFIYLARKRFFSQGTLVLTAACAFDNSCTFGRKRSCCCGTDLWKAHHAHANGPWRHSSA